MQDQPAVSLRPASSPPQRPRGLPAPSTASQQLPCFTPRAWGVVPREERPGEQAHVGREGGNRKFGQEIQAPKDLERSPERVVGSRWTHPHANGRGARSGTREAWGQGRAPLLGSKPCCEQLLLSCAGPVFPALCALLLPNHTAQGSRSTPGW